MSRLACLSVPLFPLAARLRAEPELAGKAMAVCEGSGTAARLVAASRAARGLGLKVGMTLAQARSILPDVIARGRDPLAERSAHEALLEAAAALSPRVQDLAADQALADVDGMDRLFPGDDGERELAHAAIRVAESLQLPVRVGIASTRLAARLAASRPGSPTVVPTGGEADFLAPLPLTHLALERRLLTTLGRWGVATLGELARLPADRVASRLGPAGAAAHRAARGEDIRPLVPSEPPEVLAEGLEMEWPVVTVEPLLAALRPCLERLCQRLARQDLACSVLELEVGLEPEGVDRRSIRLPAPGRTADTLLALLRQEVEARPPQAPVISFRCLAHPTTPRRSQLTLFGAPEIDPDRLALTLARLVALLGAEQVGSPRPVDGWLPERSASAPFDPPPPPPVRRLMPRNGRGLLAVRVLRPPVALEVILDDPGSSPLGAEGRPMSLASHQGAEPRIQGLVRVAAGPWQLEEGWWREHPVERDYWDVELSGGGLYRIYRDRRSNEWYADGLYD